MSEFILILIWLVVTAMMCAMIPTKQYVQVQGKIKLCESWFYAILIFVPVIYMAANRGWIGDTYLYVELYNQLPETMSELLAYLPEATKDKGFTLLGGIIKIIFGNSSRTYFFILAIIQSAALIYVYRNYSSNYWLSVFLFIASTDYISWMYNGIRQFTAVTLIFFATPLMLKRKWIPLILIILGASTIHGSAVLMLPVVFIVQGRAWNKKTMTLMLSCLVALAFAEQFTNILDTVLLDTQYTNVVSDWKDLNDDGTNIIRVLVYSMPALLAFFGKKWIDVKADPFINLCVNMSIISAALYLLSAGTSGVYIGRLPIYTSLYGYILLPYLIDQVFTKKSAQIVKIIMVAAYLGFYFFQIHFVWGLI